MMTSSNGNIFRVTGLLCGGFTGHRWMPRTKTLTISMICAWTNRWANNKDNGDLKRYRAHYDVIIMIILQTTQELETQFFLIGGTNFLDDAPNDVLYPSTTACGHWSVSSAVRPRLLPEGVNTFFKTQMAAILQTTFQYIFLKWKCSFFNSKLTSVCSIGSNLQLAL